MLNERVCREAARDAFQAAKSAFEKNPPIGTLEWEEWQQLLKAAIAANDSYIRDADDGSPR
jgi:hypothetical protein